MTDEGPVSSPVIIRKFPGFWDLYADSGVAAVEAPRARERVKFKTAIDQMGDQDLENIRKYDRQRSGGYLNE